MKPIKVLMLLIVLAAMATGTGMVSGMPFDGFSDVDITAPHEYREDLSNFGTAVANAGDLNGDGYADLVIGDSGLDKVYVYFGGSSFDNVPDNIIEGPPGAYPFGSAVANAGDLNNDSYADLVINAVTAHKVFVYFGGPLFDDLPDVVIEDVFGYSIANAGDLNDDGITDLVVGDDDENAYVYFGGSSFDNVPDITIADHPQVPPYYGGFGHSIANAGDLNRDGHTDLVIGAPGLGEAYVYFGGPSFDGFSDVNITDPDLTPGGSFGSAVANAGDLNNDGRTDLVIIGNDKVYVYFFGYAWWFSFDGLPDVVITDHMFPHALATAGDLNNDGYADLVIGSSGERKAYVYFGVDDPLKYPLKYLPQPTIVTLQGKLTDTAGNPIQTGSLQVTINDTLGNQVWQSTFDDCLFDGVFNIPLGAVQELRLIPGNIYQMVIEIDVDSTTFQAADVTFGDNVPVGDVIKFTA